MIDGKEHTPEQMLERLGFARKEFATYVRDLSGGQRRRLSILCVLMQEPNVLVLDEPGNDLDTDMLAVLEDLLDTWPGTLILVSHDRYLMERVTDDQYAILGRGIRHVPGGVDEYLRLLSQEAHAPAAEKSVAAGPKAASGERDSADVAPQTPALTNAERRELKRREGAVARRLERLQGQPDELRAQMAQIDASDYAALMEAQEKVRAVEEEIDALETEWLELSERLG